MKRVIEITLSEKVETIIKVTYSPELVKDRNKRVQPKPSPMKAKVNFQTTLHFDTVDELLNFQHTLDLTKE